MLPVCQALTAQPLPTGKALLPIGHIAGSVPPTLTQTTCRPANSDALPQARITEILIFVGLLFATHQLSRVVQLGPHLPFTVLRRQGPRSAETSASAEPALRSAPGRAGAAFTSR